MIASLIEVESQDDLVEWVEAFGVSHLVGADYDEAVWEAYHHYDSRPQYVVIDRDFVVTHVGLREDDAQDAALDAL